LGKLSLAMERRIYLERKWGAVYFASREYHQAGVNS
jgi:hypothetical protein